METAYFYNSKLADPVRVNYIACPYSTH